MKKYLTAFLMGLWAWTAGYATLPQGQDISAIEEELLEWINKERTARRLHSLKSSQDLKSVAVGQSKDMGLAPLKLDTRSSKNASNISRQLSEHGSGSFVFPEGLMNRQVLTYATEDLRVWPSNLDPTITNPSLRRIGIGIGFKENKETKNPTFWITLIL